MARGGPSRPRTGRGPVEELRCRVDEVAAALPTVRQLEAQLGHVTMALAELDRRTAERDGRLTRLEGAESIGAVMAWVEHAHLSTSPLCRSSSPPGIAAAG